MSDLNFEEKSSKKEISGIWVLIIFASLLGFIITMALASQ